MALRVSQPTPLPPPSQAATAGAADGELLPINWASQDRTNWCWIACCQMVFNSTGPTGLQQCDIASNTLGGDCCQPDACNVTGDSADVFDGYKYDYGAGAAPLPPADIKAQIDAKSPIEVYFDGGDHAHVVLITGYYADGAFQVLDPDSGYGPRAYAEICAGLGTGGAWNQTYVGIRPKTAGPWALG